MAEAAIPSSGDSVVPATLVAVQAASGAESADGAVAAWDPRAVFNLLPPDNEQEARAAAAALVAGTVSATPCSGAAETAGVAGANCVAASLPTVCREVAAAYTELCTFEATTTATLCSAALICRQARRNQH